MSRLTRFAQVVVVLLLLPQLSLERLLHSFSSRKLRSSDVGDEQFCGGIAAAAAGEQQQQEEREHRG